METAAKLLILLQRVFVSLSKRALKSLNISLPEGTGRRICTAVLAGNWLCNSLEIFIAAKPVCIAIKSTWMEAMLCAC